MERKGTITRPTGASESIIRIVGDAENHLVDDGIIDLEIPDVPIDWDEALHCMFAECHDSPLRLAGGELIEEDD